MAMNSPGSYINLKSPRSPRQLPQLPKSASIISSNCQRSPNPALQNVSCKSPSTPRVFEFPPEYYPETPNANFDYDEFGKLNRNNSGSRSSLLPDSSNVTVASNIGRSGSFCSQKSSSSSIKSSQNSPDVKSQIFQFCKPRKQFGKTLSYPPKSPVSPSKSTPPGPFMRMNKSPTSCSSMQNFNHQQKSSIKSIERPRRNSCFNLGPSNSPTTIITASSRSPSPRNADNDVFETCLNEESHDQYHKSVGDKTKFSKKQNSHDSPHKIRERLGSLHLNRSHGCLNEALERTYMRSSVKAVSRRSTSDLTELDTTSVTATTAAVDEAETEVTILSSPRRRGSMKGGLGNCITAIQSLFTRFYVYHLINVRLFNRSRIPIIEHAPLSY
ncbi:hypothetical protein PV325_009442 [Microctonus aethiopoides]|nr:hypothetical protein PV325_009442 [Microctonus aethiopoides]